MVKLFSSDMQVLADKNLCEMLPAETIIGMNTKEFTT